jgi:hypothetical protein
MDDNKNWKFWNMNEGVSFSKKNKFVLLFYNYIM